MTRIDRMLKLAEKEAETVEYRWRLGCVSASGGKLLSRGKNKPRHDPLIHPEGSTEHAEEAMLRRLPKGG